MNNTPKTDVEMDLIYYKNQCEEYQQKYKELKIQYEELQEVLVSTDEELDYYREKFVNEAIQHEYLKKELVEVKSRLSVVEAFIRDANRLKG